MRVTKILRATFITSAFVAALAAQAAPLSITSSGIGAFAPGVWGSLDLVTGSSLSGLVGAVQLLNASSGSGLFGDGAGNSFQLAYVPTSQTSSGRRQTFTGTWSFVGGSGIYSGLSSALSSGTFTYVYNASRFVPNVGVTTMSIQGDLAAITPAPGPAALAPFALGIVSTFRRRSRRALAG
jgi:hypothetical protein